MRVVALAKYGSEAASTRQRILQYSEAFEAAGIELDCRALPNNDYVRSLVDGSRFGRTRVISSYLSRMTALLREPAADAYWVYADLFPYLPASFDRLLHRLKRPIVIDWDDAFFEAYARHSSPFVRLLFRKKLDHLVSRADAITCGNRYLYDYAAKFSATRVVVPTVVDTDKLRPAESRSHEVPVIGWIGSASTWSYVRPLLPLLRRLIDAGEARVLVIGAGRAGREDEDGRIEFREWREDREVSDLQEMDIGIMPVPDRPWERGKSGYKLIQYMACGFPCVASPVGANRDIVVPEVTGLFATDEDEWRTALEGLLKNPLRREVLGREGRRRCVESYSLKSQAPRLVELFHTLHTERS